MLANDVSLRRLVPDELAKNFGFVQSKPATAFSPVAVTLDELGSADNTLILFTSDNGGEAWSDMGPLSDAKFTLWEGGIRVAALARWPGVIPAGTTSEQVAVRVQ